MLMKFSFALFTLLDSLSETTSCSESHRKISKLMILTKQAPTVKTETKQTKEMVEGEAECQGRAQAGTTQGGGGGERQPGEA